MSQLYQWHHLTTQQLGRYAEYYFKMRLVLYGIEVYSSEVDDRGIDFVVCSRREAKRPRYWDIQVKAVRAYDSGAYRYTFFKETKFQIHPNLVAAIARFSEGNEPALFLVPAAAWLSPTLPFVHRKYQNRKSEPEYGIEGAKRHSPLLAPFAFDRSARRLFGPPVVVPVPDHQSRAAS